MTKIAIYKGGMFNEGQGEKLSCCLCDEDDYTKLHVERIGISIGMSGDDYTFCKRCWLSKDLGKKLLAHIGYPHGLKLLEDSIEIIEAKESK